ncbi:MAG: DNA/RNA nuclease SfsA [Clostridiales bacterium]|nr:DNA/RNA nuclease SfsA [Clostridiales bacterium]
MQYKTMREARFLERPNRFVAIVELDGKKEKVHVKNTGRCRELLQPGVRVWLEDSRAGEDGPVQSSEGKGGQMAESAARSGAAANPKAAPRKTRYDLITVEKGRRLVNMDSQAPNKAAEEALRAGNLRIPGFDPEVMTLQREKTLGDSRFDLYLEQEGRKAYIEVKGVTLEEEGICRFPDAPTERGMKHLKGLEEAAAAGHTAAVLFVIQMKDVVRFEPHEERHKAFADALRHAAANGVQVLACDCRVTPDSMNLKDPVPVIL